jgi:hypothetical protein
MDMNIRITITITIVFILVFGALFVSHYDSTSSKEGEKNYDEFFTKQFDNDKKIFILGSSHIGTLNTTLVNQIINNYDSKFEVFHLGYNGDKPEKREQMLPDILTLNPSLVVYGISYRDFGSFNSNEEPKFYDIKQYWEITVNEFNEKESVNPQLMIRKILRNALVDMNTSQTPTKDITPINTPFTTISETEMKIMDKDSIKRQVLNSINSPSTLKIPLENNQQVESLKKIIKEFQDNDIKVIIFLTPLTEEYTKNLSDSTKTEFKKIIFEIEKEFSLKIYDFTNKYSEFNVWHDLDHVAYNEKSMIYTKDLGEIIIFEMDV